MIYCTSTSESISIILHFLVVSAQRTLRHLLSDLSVHLLADTMSGFVVMSQEEQEYVELVAAEKHQQEAVKSALAQNKTLSMLDEILEDVRKAADRLEEEIEEHAFDYNKQVSKHSQCLNMISSPVRMPTPQRGAWNQNTSRYQ